MREKVGIVIVNYNGALFNSDCIDSIKKSNYEEYEIIVVDNASTDNSLNILVEEYKDDITIIKSKENLGFSGGNNLGIEYAIKNGCNYIMLLNNDTIIDANMISLMMCEIDENTVITPKIYYYDNPNLIWSTGGKMRWKKGIPSQFGLGEVDNGKYDINYYVEIATGCCLVIPTKIIKEIGMLNDDYFLYYEDTDLSIRIIKSGFKIKYVSKAFMYHRVSASIGGEESADYIYYNTRNRLLFNKRNNKNNMIFYLPYFYITRVVKMFRWSILGRMECCSATLKAIKDYHSGNFGKKK